MLSGHIISLQLKGIKRLLVDYDFAKTTPKSFSAVVI